MRIVPENRPVKYKPNLGPLNFMHAAPTRDWLLFTSHYDVNTAREKLLGRTGVNALAMIAFAGVALKGMDLAMHDNAAWYALAAVASAGALKKGRDVFIMPRLSAELGNDRPFNQ